MIATTLSCPRHKDMPRQFECTRLITAEQVIATIKLGDSAAGGAALPRPEAPLLARGEKEMSPRQQGRVSAREAHRADTASAEKAGN
jgi:hypothetical protein